MNLSFNDKIAIGVSVAHGLYSQSFLQSALILTTYATGKFIAQLVLEKYLPQDNSPLHTNQVSLPSSRQIHNALADGNIIESIVSAVKSNIPFFQNEEEKEEQAQARKSWEEAGFPPAFIQNLEKIVLFYTTHSRNTDIPKTVRKFIEENVLEEQELINPIFLKNLVTALYYKEWIVSSESGETCIKRALSKSKLKDFLSICYLNNETKHDWHHLLNRLIGDYENTEKLLEAGFITTDSIEEFYDDWFDKHSFTTRLPKLEIIQKYEQTKKRICENQSYLGDIAQTSSCLLSEVYHYELCLLFGSIDRVIALLDANEWNAASWLFFNLTNSNWSKPLSGVLHWKKADPSIQEALASDFRAWQDRQEQRNADGARHYETYYIPIPWDTYFRYQQTSTHDSEIPNYNRIDERTRQKLEDLQGDLSKLPDEALRILGINKTDRIDDIKKHLCAMLKISPEISDYDCKKQAKRKQLALHPDKVPVEERDKYHAAFQFFRKCLELFDETHFTGL